MILDWLFWFVERFEWGAKYIENYKGCNISWLSPTLLAVSIYLLSSMALNSGEGVVLCQK